MTIEKQSKAIKVHSDSKALKVLMEMLFDPELTKRVLDLDMSVFPQEWLTDIGLPDEELKKRALNLDMSMFPKEWCDILLKPTKEDKRRHSVHKRTTREKEQNLAGLALYVTWKCMEKSINSGKLEPEVTTDDKEINKALLVFSVLLRLEKLRRLDLVRYKYVEHPFKRVAEGKDACSAITISPSVSLWERMCDLPRSN